MKISHVWSSGRVKNNNKTSIKRNTSADSSQYKRPTGGEENALFTSPCWQFWQFCCWHDVLVLFQNPAWQAQTDTAVSLWVSWAKYQFHLRSSSWPFCRYYPEWCSAHMCTWFWRHGDTLGTTENAFFSCIYNLQITISPTSSFSASFNIIVSKITPNLRLVL